MAVDDSYTVSLLHMDGGPRLWTAAGNAQIDTAQSKFGGASMLFDGTGDYITTPDSEDFYFAAADFTIDLWVRFNTFPAGTLAAGTGAVFVAQYLNASRGLIFGLEKNGANYNLAFIYNSVAVIISDNLTVSTNTWYHFTIVRDGGTLRFFQDGVAVGTDGGAIASTAINNSTSVLSLGSYDDFTLSFMNGWIDECRVSKGIARWTTSFTPETSAYTTDAYTVSLLHGDGTDAATTFTDAVTVIDTSNNFVDESGKTWTANGNAQIDTAQSKFGGASGLFDGTGDYIDTPDSEDFYFSGDFTTDFWIRFNALPAVSSAMIFWSQTTDANNVHFFWFYNNAGTYELYYDVYSGGSLVVRLQRTWSTPATNTWYHLALIRTGNDIMVFVDGVKQGATLTDVDFPGNFTGVFTIGQYNSTYYVNGWIDEFRVSKGIARWTTTFTPPTAPYGPPAGGFFF